MVKSAGAAKLAGATALKNAFGDLTEEMEPTEAYAVGSPINYGRYLETGTSRMPAYLWLQPSVDEMLRKGATIAEQSQDPDELIRKAALEIESIARRRLQNKATRPYPQTGTLAGSVEAVPIE